MSVSSTNATVSADGVVRFTYDGVIRAQVGSEIAAAVITGTITETQIADNAISTPKLQAASVVTAKLAAAAVTAGKIAAEAVEATAIKAGAVIAGKIAAEAVEATAIKAGAVTAVKIATGAVTAGKIEAGAVTAEKIAVSELSAITANLGTVTAGVIQGPTIRTGASGARVVLSSSGLQAFDGGGVEVLSFSTTSGNLFIKGELKAGSVVPATTITGLLTNAQIAELAAAKITGTITESQIGSEAISTPKLKAGAVSTASLAAGAVTAEKVAVAELSAITANLGTVIAGVLKSVTIESGDLLLPEYQEGAEEGAPFIEWGGGFERIVGAKRSGVHMLEIRANDISSGAGQVRIEAKGQNPTIVGRFSARARLFVESEESSTVKVALRTKNGTEAFHEATIFGSGDVSSFLQVPSVANRRIVFGVVGETGAKVSGDGFTVKKTATGTYEVTYAVAMTERPGIGMVQIDSTKSRLAPAQVSESTTGFTVLWRTTAGAAADTPFGFIAIG